MTPFLFVSRRVSWAWQENLGPVGLLKQEISIETCFDFPSLPALRVCMPVHALSSSLPCVLGQRSHPSCSPKSAGSSRSREDSGKGLWTAGLGQPCPLVSLSQPCAGCQKRDETGLWEKLPVILCSCAEGGQLCLPAGNQHGSASCSPVEPAFIFNNPQRGFVAHSWPDCFTHSVHIRHPRPSHQAPVEEEPPLQPVVDAHCGCCSAGASGTDCAGPETLGKPQLFFDL